MRIFVSEYICGGALSEGPLPVSLLREGRAMLGAIVGDLLALPGCQVVTTLDRRLSGDMAIHPDDALGVQVVDDAAAERAAFDQFTAQADATLVIAPETDGALLHRVERVREIGALSLNALPAAIDLCGDKLRLAGHLHDRGIATIPTESAAACGDPWNLFGTSCVMKPRDGAGSWLTFAISQGDTAAWQRAVGEFTAAGCLDRAILQPWVAGRALSVGCLCDAAGAVELFPIADQRIDQDNFQYTGGRIPAPIPPSTAAAIERLVRSACETISGLRGYIGVDLLLPAADPDAPLIVEINPRLTTSYVGYRRLCEENIASRLIQPALPPLAVRWKSSTVSFQADGTPT